VPVSFNVNLWCHVIWDCHSNNITCQYIPANSFRRVTTCLHICPSWAGYKSLMLLVGSLIDSTNIYKSLYTVWKKSINCSASYKPYNAFTHKCVDTSMHDSSPLINAAGMTSWLVTLLRRCDVVLRCCNRLVCHWRGSVPDEKGELWVMQRRVLCTERVMSEVKAWGEGCKGEC
jgi:hypothetical protein